jgi:hypothetical protein
MSIQSIIANYMASQPQSSSASATGKTVEQTFMDYMKESPAQRMIDQWLKAHHLTEKQLQAMPAAQREAVEKQMANDIENSIKQKIEDKLEASELG